MFCRADSSVFVMPAPVIWEGLFQDLAESCGYIDVVKLCSMRSNEVTVLNLLVQLNVEFLLGRHVCVYSVLSAPVAATLIN